MKRKTIWLGILLWMTMLFTGCVYYGGGYSYPVVGYGYYAGYGFYGAPYGYGYYRPYPNSGYYPHPYYYRGH
jgi:hypothetical protein